MSDSILVCVSLFFQTIYIYMYFTAIPGVQTFLKSKAMTMRLPDLSVGFVLLAQTSPMPGIWGA